MTEEEEDDEVSAAEFILGTLSPPEMQVAALRALEDEAFAGRIAWWREHFAQLDTSPPEIPVSRGLWRKVDLLTRAVDRMDGHTPVEALVSIAKQKGRWKAAAFMTAALLGACIVAGLAYFHRHPPQGERYVAVVNEGGTQPALLLMVDVASHKVLVHSLAAEPPPGRSLELWYTAEGEAPRSLGVLSPHSSAAIGLDDLPLKLGDKPATLAISSEPPGGSPTGRPSGPMLYSGPLLPLK